VTLGDGRLRVRRGQMVSLSPWVLHRDGRWWDAPLSFRPERFTRDARPTPFSYIPFGAGKRACIGRSFALLEAAMAIPVIVRAVDLEIDTTKEPELLPQITLRPGGRGMRAVVRRRMPR
jgi:cytochrome P450